MIARRNFFRKLFGGLIVAAFTAPAVGAEPKSSKHRHAAADSPSPTPASAETPAKPDAPARIRLWRASDSPDQPVQIRFLPYGKPDSEAFSPLQAEAGNYQFSSYVVLPAAGAMVVEVSAPDHPAVRLPLYLADGGQSTLLVRQQGTNLTAEWIDDTPATTDNVGDFCVYNLLPASGEVVVTLGGILNAHIPSTRSNVRFSGLKRVSYPVNIEGTDGNGKNFRWNTDADFRQYRKATLVIYPDAYGRVRPRIYPA